MARVQSRVRCQWPAPISHVELPKWVPGTVLCSSDHLGWQDVALRTWRYQGQDVEIPPMDSFMVVRYRQGCTPMDRQFDGHWTRTRCQPGHFSLLSRSAESHWHWTEPVEVSHLYLSNALMSRVAADITGNDHATVELHDVLCGSDAHVNRLVDDITREATQDNPGGTLLAEALGVQLAVHLLRDYATVDTPEKASGKTLSHAQLVLLNDYIEENLHRNISLEAMANRLQLGVWTFGRRIQTTLGCTSSALVQQRRVERARHSLTNSDVALKQVAAQCGFSDQSHMTRQFRIHLGVTPGAYRQTRR